MRRTYHYIFAEVGEAPPVYIGRVESPRAATAFIHGAMFSDLQHGEIRTVYRVAYGRKNSRTWVSYGSPDEDDVFISKDMHRYYRNLDERRNYLSALPKNVARREAIEAALRNSEAADPADKLKARKKKGG